MFQHWPHNPSSGSMRCITGTVLSITYLSQLARGSSASAVAGPDSLVFADPVAPLDMGGRALSLDGDEDTLSGGHFEWNAAAGPSNDAVSLRSLSPLTGSGWDSHDPFGIGQVGSEPLLLDSEADIPNVSPGSPLHWFTDEPRDSDFTSRQVRATQRSTIGCSNTTW